MGKITDKKNKSKKDKVHYIPNELPDDLYIDSNGFVCLKSERPNLWGRIKELIMLSYWNNEW